MNEVGENSFTLEPTETGWIAQSKFYPDGTGAGATVEAAIAALNQRLIYIQDNDPDRWQRVQKMRIANAKRGMVQVTGTFNGRGTV